jgi:integrase
VLAEIIERRLAARIFGCPLVFHNGRGESVGDFYGTWRRAGERAKVPRRCYYDLRRTAARNLRAAGVPESVIMAIGGWRTNAMFRRYAITDESVISDAMARGAAYIATLPTKLEKSEKQAESGRLVELKKAKRHA